MPIFESILFQEDAGPITIVRVDDASGVDVLHNWANLYPASRNLQVRLSFHAFPIIAQKA